MRPCVSSSLASASGSGAGSTRVRTSSSAARVRSNRRPWTSSARRCCSRTLASLMPPLKSVQRITPSACRSVVLPSKPSMSWPARARPSMLNLRPELGLGSADFLARRRKVGHRFAHPRVLAAGVRFGLLERRRHALRQVRRHRHAVDRNAGQRAECDRRGVEVLARLGHPGARRLQPLFGLLLVGDADRALGDAFAKVAGEPLVEGHIVLGDRDQPLLEQIVDVGARDVERDEFGALLDPRRGGVGARRLAADLRLAAAAVDRPAGRRSGRPRSATRSGRRCRCAAPGRVAQAANAGRTFDRDARIIEALPCCSSSSVAARLETAWRISGLVFSAD